MRYMLDTDMASYIIRSKSPILEARLQTMLLSDVVLSAMTQGELLYGIQRLPASHRLQVEVRKLFGILQVLPWPPEAAESYAEIRHQLVSEGQPIGEMDMLIAAHAISAGVTLVTNNTRHYSRIKAPLQLENWAV